MHSAAYMQGLLAGGGLIVAIGAQNAFVLSQGVRREHHLAIALVCAMCDAALIAAGVLGVGAAVAASPVLAKAAALGGICFLGWYGLRSFRSMLRGGTLETCAGQGRTLRQALVLTLAVTLLNPHVYLDTVVLLGSLSGGFQGQGRYLFGAGAVTASFIWFHALAMFGRGLAPLFRRPATWRTLDGLVGLTMWGIAAGLATRTWA